MAYNVLVLAMSTLNNNILRQENVGGTTYQLKENGNLVGNTYNGIGQLEAVPLFIQDAFHTHLTHVIVLATPETQQAIDFNVLGPQQTYDKLIELYGDRLDMTDVPCLRRRIPQQMSHLEFFVRRMWHEGVRPEFEVVDVNQEDPSDGLRVLLRRIQELYIDCPCDESGSKDWHLWVDDHGGFRDVSMAMFALVQVLVAPDEQDFAKYMEHDEAFVEGIKHMGDSLSTVPVTGVYTIAFNPNDAKAGKPQAILDKTKFYRTFTEPAVQAYMNYGQYAQISLKSDVNLKSDSVDPYAFISYRRNEARLERYAFLGSLKRYGYRYWYDDGIELHEDWRNTLRKAIEHCAVFIAIVTKTYYESEQCVRELRQAIDGGKLIILVSPDETPLYVANKDIVVGDVQITREELEGIAGHQQFDYKTHIMNEVFQEPRVRERLAWLSEHDARFGSIRKSKE